MFISRIILVAALLLGGNLVLAGLLDFMGLLSLPFVILLFFEYVGVFYFYLHKSFFKPFHELYESLAVIDFNNDIIDFTKIDSLKPSGCAEIQELIKKYKYFMDIIAERINKINAETYKSEHDGLTGCYNRVRLENMKPIYQNADTVCIIFIDVNNLKKMNDIFGHEAGDALLKAAAEKLKFWNTYGEVYRLGGDEYMIVVVNKDRASVEALIKRWYPTVGILNRTSDGFKCVLSYGVSFGYRGCDFDSLQKQADEAMYDMKVAIKKKFGEPMR